MSDFGHTVPSVCPGPVVDQLMALDRFEVARTSFTVSPKPEASQEHRQDLSLIEENNEEVAGEPNKNPTVIRWFSASHGCEVSMTRSA